MLFVGIAEWHVPSGILWPRRCYGDRLAPAGRGPRQVDEGYNSADAVLILGRHGGQQFLPFSQEVWASDECCVLRCQVLLDAEN